MYDNSYINPPYVVQNIGVQVVNNFSPSVPKHHCNPRTSLDNNASKERLNANQTFPNAVPQMAKSSNASSGFPNSEIADLYSAQVPTCNICWRQFVSYDQAAEHVKTFHFDLLNRIQTNSSSSSNQLKQSAIPSGNGNVPNKQNPKKIRGSVFSPQIPKVSGVCSLKRKSPSKEVVSESQGKERKAERFDKLGESEKSVFNHTEVICEGNLAESTPTACPISAVLIENASVLAGELIKQEPVSSSSNVESLPSDEREIPSAEKISETCERIAETAGQPAQCLSSEEKCESVGVITSSSRAVPEKDCAFRNSDEPSSISTAESESNDVSSGQTNVYRNEEETVNDSIEAVSHVCDNGMKSPAPNETSTPEVNQESEDRIDRNATLTANDCSEPDELIILESDNDADQKNKTVPSDDPTSKADSINKSQLDVLKNESRLKKPINSQKLKRELKALACTTVHPDSDLQSGQSNLEVFRCSRCDESFSSNFSYLAHCQKYHFKQFFRETPSTRFKAHRCRKCGVNFESSSLLKQHLLRCGKFNQLSKLICPNCNRNFAAKSVQSLGGHLAHCKRRNFETTPRKGNVKPTFSILQMSPKNRFSVRVMRKRVLERQISRFHLLNRPPNTSGFLRPLLNRHVCSGCNLVFSDFKLLLEHLMESVWNCNLRLSPSQYVSQIIYDSKPLNYQGAPRSRRQIFSSIRTNAVVRKLLKQIKEKAEEMLGLMEPCDEISSRVILMIRRNSSLVSETWFADCERTKLKSRYFLDSISIYCQPIMTNFRSTSPLWLRLRALAKYLVETANEIRVRSNCFDQSTSEYLQAVYACFSNSVSSVAKPGNIEYPPCFDVWAADCLGVNSC